MSQKHIYQSLRIAILGIGLCGVVLYGYFLPFWGYSTALTNPEVSYYYWPWLCFLWCTAIPFYIILVLAWKISNEIKADRSFSPKNAHLLKCISILTYADTGIFFVGNVILVLLNMHHPGVILISLFIIIIGVVVALAVAVLSRLVVKAAALQEQSDYTV